MSNYEVGYKKPPLHSRFKKGTRGNPKGRGKRKGTTHVEALNHVLDTVVEYRQGGKSKRAPRIEVAINRIGTTALEGDVGAADMLLDLREHFEKHTDFNFITKILIITKLV